MKKVGIIILVLLILFTTSCGKKDISKGVIEHRSKIIETIGVTNDKRIVVKTKNKNKEDSYYVYEFTNIGYTEYAYIFYKNKANYDDALVKYHDSYYQLKPFPEALATKVTLVRASKRDDEDLYATVLKRYQTKKFTIIKK